MEPPVSWSPEETRALIDVWSEEKGRRELEAPLRNESVYLEMSNRLAARGISRSAKQCRAKIKLLKQEYGGFKLECDSGEAAGKTHDAADSGMSKRHAEDTTNSTEQPDTVILELMISDVETGALLLFYKQLAQVMHVITSVHGSGQKFNNNVHRNITFFNNDMTFKYNFIYI